MRGFNFPYLKDVGGAVARSYQVACTPLDSDLAIVYSGRIDDSRTGAAVRSGDLEAAVADIAAGRPVASRRRRHSAAASSGRPAGPYSGGLAAGQIPAPFPPAKREEHLFISGRQDRLLFSKEADTQGGRSHGRADSL